jgi:hypothetical protein
MTPISSGAIGFQTHGPRPEEARSAVSKDGHTCCGLLPSFETRASKSTVADFDTTNGCRSRAGPTSVRAPQDEVLMISM